MRDIINKMYVFQEGKKKRGWKTKEKRIRVKEGRRN